MLEKNLRLVDEAFKKYYFDHFDKIHVPIRTSEREFGYQKFNSVMRRHLSIKSDKELHLLLMTEVPSDVYCSNGFYSFPNLPMSEKDWKEADLIFDLDAKDLNLPCRKEHTCITCNDCNTTSIFQSKCPKCGSSKIESKSTTCENCIAGLKNEVKKLIEILTEDLGIKNETIQVFFSGNEGFHIHIVNNQYQTLTSKERTELIDYIMFRGAIPETFGMSKQDFSKSSFPEPNEKGWAGRISKSLLNSKSKRKKVIQQILLGGYSSFQAKLEQMQNTLGIKIDTNVTSDIHRIFRLGGSINSKSGLSKILCKDLDTFDPYSDACFIDEQKVEVLADCPVQFKLKNSVFGPFNNEKISVPKYAAVYLICKNLAVVS